MEQEHGSVDTSSDYTPKQRLIPNSPQPHVQVYQPVPYDEDKGQGGYQLPQTRQPGFPPQQYGSINVQQQRDGSQNVFAQPDGWMPAPRPELVADCPPGLEYLTQIDQLLIKQQVELLEVFTGFETNNKYKVQNSLGQQVYLATEDTDCCTRNCCGPARPFDIRVLDNMQQEVIHLSRPLRCSSCCFPCCLQELEVQAPPGHVVGHVRQKWSLCHPKFAITTATNETVLQIQGPWCQCNICGDVEYKVLSADGISEVGKVSKQWSGLAKELFTDANNFGITFPMDLDVKVKATVLGAAFLIGFMFFEKDDEDRHERE